MPTASELRALADQVEHVEALEETARAAKDAYRADTTDPGLRAAHRAASQDLAQARDAIRAAGVTAADAIPESLTVRPASTGGKVTG